MRTSSSNRSDEYTDVPTTELHIPSVTFRTACFKHEAAAGEPCFSHPSADGKRTHDGICNSRAIRAGMNGWISPSSLVRLTSYSKAA